MVSPPWLARQLSFILEFTSSIQQLPDSENTVADGVSWFLPWKFSFPDSLKQFWIPCSEFSFSSSLLQCFSDLRSTNWLFQPCPAPETVFRNSESNFKACAPGATSSFLQSFSFMWSLYGSSRISSTRFSSQTLVSPTSWFVSHWSLSLSQVNFSTFCLEKSIQRCWSMVSFLVRIAKSKATSVPVFHKLLFPVEGSDTFMLILLDLYQFLEVLIIFLPWWIRLLDGLRSFLSLLSLQLVVLRLCFQYGFPGSEFHRFLLQILEHKFTSSLWKEFCLLLRISHTKTTLFYRSLKSSLCSKLAGLGGFIIYPCFS